MNVIVKAYQAYRRHLIGVAERKSFISLVDFQWEILPWFIFAVGSGVLGGLIAGNASSVALVMWIVAGLIGIAAMILIGWTFISADIRRRAIRRDEE